MKKIIVAFLTFAMLSTLISHMPNANAEFWSDDFTNTNLNFDSRWFTGGLGSIVPFNGTYAEAVSFTTEYTEGWHGPWIKTDIAASGDFNISAILDCIADLDKETVGKLEIRFLDTAGNQIFSMGWHDAFLTLGNRQTFITLRGSQDDIYLYSSEDGTNLKYTIFADKELRLVRHDGTLDFYIAGTLAYSGDGGTKALGGVKIEMLKHEISCTPEFMRVDSITVDTTEASVPSAPQNLEAEPSSGFAFVSWDSPADNGGLPITSYKIYRGTVSGTVQYLTTVGNVNTFNDTGLTDGQTYYYQISAVNGIGEGVLSSEVSTKPVGLPGVPTSFQAISGPDHVNLTWEPPASDGGSSINNYVVYRDGEILETISPATSYSDTGLTVGLEYTYQLSAVNSIGEGALTPEVLAVPGETQHLPMAPRDFMALEGDASVHLSWSPPSSNGNSFITNYTIYRGTTSGSESQLITLGQVFEYNDNSVTNNQTYFYQVTATNGVGESPASAEMSTMPHAPLVPSEPMFLESSVGLNLVTLNWSSPLSNGGAEITGYKIYRANGSGSANLIAQLGPVQTYTDIDVIGGTHYNYSISAVNVAGEGPQSSAIEAIPEAPPSQFTNYTESDPNAGGISLTSTIVTAIVLLVTIIIVLIYIKRPDKPTN